jgi:hypothetical protein
VSPPSTTEPDTTVIASVSRGSIVLSNGGMGVGVGILVTAGVEDGEHPMMIAEIKIQVMMKSHRG